VRHYFHALADAVRDMLEPEELCTCLFEAEESDFVRFNCNRVRQAGSVLQRELTIDLIAGRRHTNAMCSLTGVFTDDCNRLQALIRLLREQRAHVKDDPYLLYATEIHNTENIQSMALPDTGEVLNEIMDAADGLDFVGFWANGTIYKGFANTLGQFNWDERRSFNLDWSCYDHADKAVKCRYAGFSWNPDELARTMGEAREQLAILGRPSKTVPPGQYRVYLAPMALHEILKMMAWGGFGLKSHRTLQTPLIKMVREDRRLNARLNLYENHKGGLTPEFTTAGFIKPARVPLIRKGAYQDCLVSARSSKEYAEPVNAESESPQSLDMDGGNIAQQEISAHLDTGLYINNLWYTNFSDPNDCRITGMTRFATFWIHNGKITNPVDAMRFDESAYRMLGDNLIDLTQEQAFLMSPATYCKRSVESSRVPGALIEDFTLTL
jgi:predicted Zn-dependent protease